MNPHRQSSVQVTVIVPPRKGARSGEVTVKRGARLGLVRDPDFFPFLIRTMTIRARLKAYDKLGRSDGDVRVVVGKKVIK